VFLIEDISTYSWVDGAIWIADVAELLTHHAHNAPAAKIRHRDAEYMIKDSVAFYGCHKLVVGEKNQSIEMSRRDLRF
jgi:hypothetical protein